jgi:hypothetical protein
VGWRGFKVWADGKTKGFIEPKGSRRREKVWADRWAEVREKVRGEYGFSSLMKQNKKAKICFVIYIAGFFFNFFLL